MKIKILIFSLTLLFGANAWGNEIGQTCKLDGVDFKNLNMFQVDALVAKGAKCSQTSPNEGFEDNMVNIVIEKCYIKDNLPTLPLLMIKYINNTEYNFETLQINFGVYDANDNLIDMVYTYTNLRPQQRTIVEGYNVGGSNNCEEISYITTNHADFRVWDENSNLQIANGNFYTQILSKINIVNNDINFNLVNNLK